MHPNELANKLALSGPERYRLFVHQVAGEQWLWSLKGPGGWVSAAGDGYALALPVWPDLEFAELCAVDAWAGCVPEKLDIDAFVGKWLPGMRADGVGVAVFATPTDRAVFVSASELISDLEEELDGY